MAVDAKYKIARDVLQGLYQTQYRAGNCEEYPIDIAKSYINHLNCVDTTTSKNILAEYCGNYSCIEEKSYVTSFFNLRRIFYRIPEDTTNYNIEFYVATEDLFSGHAPYTYAWEGFEGGPIGEDCTIYGSSTESTLKVKVADDTTLDVILMQAIVHVTDSNHFIATQYIQHNYVVEHPVQVYHTITASIAGDLSFGQIRSGNYISNAQGILTLEVLEGSDVSLWFQSFEGFYVSAIEVNSVPKTPTETYLISNVTTDYTVEVTFAEAAVDEFLERSDLPGTFYSTLHTALQAVKAAYPTGLTQDVTITCITEALEIRDPQDPDKLTNERLWTAILKEWNKDTEFTLTIDGDNKYTLSCYSLGGVMIDRCDNIIFKGIKFVDYANFYKVYSPEEMSGIYSIGTLASKNKNIVVADCTFEGKYTNPDNSIAYAHYAIDTKLTSNLVVYNTILDHAGAIPVKSTDIDILEMRFCNISGNIKRSTVAHETLLSISGASLITITDSILNGNTLEEYGVTFVEAKKIVFKRNEIHNFAGTAILISGDSLVDIDLHSCIFYNCINRYILNYLKFIFRIEQPINNLSVLNNVFYMNGLGAYFQEAIAIQYGVNYFSNVGNIFIDKNNRVNAFISVGDNIGDYEANENLYKASLYIDNSRFNTTRILSCTLFNTENSISENRKLSQYQTASYELDSLILGSTVNLLNFEVNPSGNFALLTTYQSEYLSTSNYAEFDIEYKMNTTQTNRGAYNLNGVVWNETTDTSSGYIGISLADNTVSFDEFAQYLAPSEDVLIITANIKDRTKLVVFKITNEANETVLLLGTSIVFQFMCSLTEGGMFIEDVLYDIEILKLAI